MCCHRTFSTNQAAELGHKHDKPLSPTTMKRRGLVKRTHKHGELWGYAPSDDYSHPVATQEGTQ
jgi:hypothetical protein